MMFIQVKSTSSVNGNAALAAQVEAVVADVLSRFDERITHVNVHLDDENSHKGGDKDNRCTMEAHLKRLKTVVVTHHAPTLDLAVVGAAEKMKASIESTIGRRRTAARSPRSDPNEVLAGEPEDVLDMEIDEEIGAEEMAGTESFATNPENLRDESPDKPTA
jgi:hypothetical protein